MIFKDYAELKLTIEAINKTVLDNLNQNIRKVFINYLKEGHKKTLNSDEQQAIWNALNDFLTLQDFLQQADKIDENTFFEMINGQHSANEFFQNKEFKNIVFFSVDSNKMDQVKRDTFANKAKEIWGVENVKFHSVQAFNQEWFDVKVKRNYQVGELEKVLIDGTNRLKIKYLKPLIEAEPKINLEDIRKNPSAFEDNWKKFYAKLVYPEIYRYINSVAAATEDRVNEVVSNIINEIHEDTLVIFLNRRDEQNNHYFNYATFNDYKLFERLLTLQQTPVVTISANTLFAGTLIGLQSLVNLNSIEEVYTWQGHAYNSTVSKETQQAEADKLKNNVLISGKQDEHTMNEIWDDVVVTSDYEGEELAEDHKSTGKKLPKDSPEIIREPFEIDDISLLNQTFTFDDDYKKIFDVQYETKNEIENLIAQDNFFKIFVENFESQKVRLQPNGEESKMTHEEKDEYEKHIFNKSIDEMYDMLKENSQVIYTYLYNHEIGPDGKWKLFTIYLHVKRIIEQLDKKIENFKLA